MEHIAIMKKSWKLTPKILTGRKKIESRWYNSKYPPWDKIKSGDLVYFKDSGDPVTLKAEVDKVLQFSNLNENKVREILESYADGDGIEKNEIPKFYELFKNKKNCVLVFLKNPQKIKPFQINKKGFGSMSSWICIDDVNKIKV